MGNNAQKLSAEDVEELRGMETTTGLDAKELMKEYKKFKKQFPTGAMSKEEFHQLAEAFLPPQQRSYEFISMLFNSFDEKKTGEIDFRALINGLNLATSEIPELRLAFHFRTFNCDRSGFLTSQDIHVAVDLIFQHNPGLEQRVGPEINTPHKVVEQIFAAADLDQDGRISYDDLKDLMINNPRKFSYLGLNLIFLPT